MVTNTKIELSHGKYFVNYNYSRPDGSGKFGVAEFDTMQESLDFLLKLDKGEVEDA